MEERSLAGVGSSPAAWPERRRRRRVEASASLMEKKRRKEMRRREEEKEEKKKKKKKKKGSDVGGMGLMGKGVGEGGVAHVEEWAGSGGRKEKEGREEKIRFE